MTIAYLEKRDAAKNMQRYYHVYITPTLFGEYAMVREWGRLGRRGGNRMESWFASKEDAIRSGQQMAETKRRRGYASPAQVEGYTPLPVDSRFVL